MKTVGTVVAVLMVATLPHSWTLPSPLERQRLVRRTSARAVLATKLDPKFWPARGRRSSDVSDPSYFLRIHDGNHYRQTSDEEGPFWANRGRDLESMTARQTDVEGPFWANRGRATEDEKPFWANRGRTTDDEGPFWANRGRAIDDEGPFRADQGRFAGGEEDGPFWANRGRDHEDEERLQRDTLYVDEPGFVLLSPTSPTYARNIQTRHSNVIENDLNKNLDTFFSARGKKSDRTKRESGVFLPIVEPSMGSVSSEDGGYWMMRSTRASKINRALEKLKDAQFWPSRGKKEKTQKHSNGKEGTCENKNN